MDISEKKTLFIGLLLGSINANAFLDFNSYAPGFDTNSNSFGPMNNARGPWNYGYNRAIPVSTDKARAMQKKAAEANK